ncbi:MAG: hypothetical protein ACTSYO_09110 [Candidatus Ranarchaeia archaeon]
MSETLPISRIKREIEELSVRILASVDVRVNEFREQVIGIKNRIAARLTGLQLGAFAPPITLTYEDAVTRLFDEFSNSLTKSIAESISAKIDELTSTLNHAEDEVEKSTLKRLEETESQLNEKLTRIKEEYESRVNQLEEELAKERSGIAEHLTAVQSKADEEKEMLTTEITNLQEKIVKLEEEKNQRLDALEKELAAAKQELEESEERFRQELANKREEWQKQFEVEQAHKEAAIGQLEEKLSELETLRELAEKKDQEIAARASEVEELKRMLKESEDKHLKELEEKDKEVTRNIAMLTGADGKKVDIPAVMRQSEEAKTLAEDAKYQIKALETEIEKLIRLTEDEPQYKVFWLLREMAPNWGTIKQLAETVGIPSVMVKRHLQRYENLGLVELKDEKARYIPPVITKVY